MSSRVSQVVLLCEDDLQARLVRAFMKLLGLNAQVREIIASRMAYGGNVSWVLNRFPSELHACRQRHKLVRTLLIVMIDADDFSTEERRRALSNKCVAAEYSPLIENDPLAILIPKRHVETWICNLLGIAVEETQDCKSIASTKKEDIRRAAQTLEAWVTNVLPESCVPSLKQSVPELRRIQDCK